MSTALTVIDPLHGEQLDLATAPDERLGQLLLEVREHESRLRELKALVNEELTRRMDFARAWTLNVGDFKLVGKSDALIAEWDVPALMEVLDGMVSRGEIAPDAVERAIDIKTEYRVKAAGVAALLKSPALAGKIETCRVMVAPEGRRVTVSRG